MEMGMVKGVLKKQKEIKLYDINLYLFIINQERSTDER